MSRGGWTLISDRGLNSHRMCDPRFESSKLCEEGEVCEDLLKAEDSFFLPGLCQTQRASSDHESEKSKCEVKLYSSWRRVARSLSAMPSTVSRWTCIMSHWKSEIQSARWLLFTRLDIYIPLQLPGACSFNHNCVSNVVCTVGQNKQKY